MKINQLQQRDAETHKGDYGRALLIGGSEGMSGAISLAGMAALRSGAGLVTLAIPSDILPIVAGHEPSYMTLPLPARKGHLAGPCNSLESAAQAASCIGCGPGLGRTEGTEEVVRWLIRERSCPILIDADALRLLDQGELEQAKGKPTLLATPHPGEFRAMIGCTETNRQKLESLAQQWAANYRAVIVLKGHRSFISDGQQSVHNNTGNPGMASGGSGDVLSGILVAFIGQGMSPYEATVEAVRIHGMAGDLAAAELGQMSTIASDLIRYLPKALQQGL